MKFFYYLLIPVLLAGCTPPPEARYTDKPMPKSELAFIKKITSSDSVYTSQLNDITKKEFLEKGQKEVASFVLNNRKIDNWVAIVHKIEAKSDPAKYIEVDLIIPIGNWREEKYPHFSFPIFVSLVDDKPNKTKDALKLLQEGDEVLISGEIEKNLSGGINIERQRGP